MMDFGEGEMRQWEYLRLDLNDLPGRGGETASLNKAGGEGWELVAVTCNGLAILKREISRPAKVGRGRAPGTTTSG
jgi:hypothetical protein